MKKRGARIKAQKERVDGITFASKREAARYRELKLLRTAGEIYDLELQPRFALVVGGVQIKTPKNRQRFYIADFCYKTKDGETVIEDVKGMLTEMYKMKRDIMAAMGYVIKEVK